MNVRLRMRDMIAAAEELRVSQESTFLKMAEDKIEVLEKIVGIDERLKELEKKEETLAERLGELEKKGGDAWATS